LAIPAKAPVTRYFIRKPFCVSCATHSSPFGVSVRRRQRFMPITKRRYSFRNTSPSLLFLYERLYQTRSQPCEPLTSVFAPIRCLIEPQCMGFTLFIVYLSIIKFSLGSDQWPIGFTYFYLNF
jgi:hypothetical protein